MTKTIIEEVREHDTTSIVALAGHPIHAMLVSFPIALVISTLGCDIFYWWGGDPFWARAGLWASGFAFWFGVAASLAGTAEFSSRHSKAKCNAPAPPSAISSTGSRFQRSKNSAGSGAAPQYGSSMTGRLDNDRAGRRALAPPGSDGWNSTSTTRR